MKIEATDLILLGVLATALFLLWVLACYSERNAGKREADAFPRRLYLDAGARPIHGADMDAELQADREIEVPSDGWTRMP